MTPRQYVDNVPYAWGLRPGAIISATMGNNAILHIENWAAKRTRSSLLRTVPIWNKLWHSWRFALARWFGGHSTIMAAAWRCLRAAWVVLACLLAARMRLPCLLKHQRRCPVGSSTNGAAFMAPALLPRC